MSWEYEGLFNAIIDRDRNPLGYEYWRNLPTEVQFGTMGYRRRTVQAGMRLEAELYPVFGRKDRGILRAAKKNITKDAQRRLNWERSKRHLIQLMDTNFTEKDAYVTLTYGGGRPEMSRVKKDLRNFFDRVKRARIRAGLPELKYIYAIGGDEMTSPGYTGNRPHIHLVMSGGISTKELIAIWDKGIVKNDPIQPNEEGLEGLSKYFMKQKFDRPEKKYARVWAGSKNLKQPKIRTSDAKSTNARVMQISYGFENEAREVMERIYPSYRFVKCSVYHSDVVRGVYIRAVMRKRE